MADRYPVCPHTLQAVRGRREAFAAELRHFPGPLTEQQLDWLSETAVRVFGDVEYGDMPEMPADLRSE